LKIAVADLALFTIRAVQDVYAYATHVLDGHNYSQIIHQVSFLSAFSYEGSMADKNFTEATFLRLTISYSLGSMQIGRQLAIVESFMLILLATIFSRCSAFGKPSF